ncbi:Cellulose 1,4-beta-cellobiosidase precursor [compost metagenome]
MYASLKQGLLAEADRLVRQSRDDGYRISLREEDYICGSNMLVMNNAMLLLAAEHFSDGEAAYADCALDHLHYLLGRNVLDISYVTGFGDRPVMHPHHRPSVGDGVADPVPGLVSGGPDHGLHDEYVVQHLQGKPAAQCFADHDLSYSTNEVTIYWNSPAVFVTARFNV